MGHYPLENWGDKSPWFCRSAGGGGRATGRNGFVAPGNAGSGHPRLRAGSGLQVWLGKHHLHKAPSSKEPSAPHRPSDAKGMVGLHVAPSVSAEQRVGWGK